MNRQTLEFALDHMAPSAWKKFEEFASEFLVSEFNSLRTVAAASGDRGRDAELFSPEGDPSVLLQYSVTEDWSSKIRGTARRVRAEFPSAIILIYVTNRRIGAQADKLKAEIRSDFRLNLDVRDREWFVERRNFSVQAQVASNVLAEEIVQPLLVSAEVIKGKALGLSGVEARAALVYLNLQWEDDTREKGLTKLCFEALVRSALRETDSSNRMSRNEIKSIIREILNAHPSGQVDIYTDAALKRLTKRFLRHWRKSDEFCLTHQERLRLTTRLTELEESDKEFQADLADSLRRASSLLGVVLTDTQVAGTCDRMRRILEKLLLSSGELFAASVKSGSSLQLNLDELPELIVKDIGVWSDTLKIGDQLVALIDRGIRELLDSTGDASRRYLRSLGDAYTLMAFLRETPDVQSAISKMFSDGHVWLDANIVLPLFAESLLEKDNRKFQSLLAAAIEIGLELRVTPGVIEELERHMNRCVAYVRRRTVWEGDAPFLASMYAATGRSLASFGSWLENFRGEKRPLEDIAEYIDAEHGVKQQELEIDSADDDLRYAVQEIFSQSKERKAKAGGAELDPITLRRLALHDTENYVGVMVKRREERAGPFGFSAWWLTLDRSAFAVDRELASKIGRKPPLSPVMSPDFLVNYLAFAPRRSRLSKATEARLPLSIGIGAIEYIPSDLLNQAEIIRDEMRNLPEHVIRRRVRDQIDEAKARRGLLSRRGLPQIEEDLLETIERQAQQQNIPKGRRALKGG